MVMSDAGEQSLAAGGHVPVTRAASAPFSFPALVDPAADAPDAGSYADRLLVKLNACRSAGLHTDTVLCVDDQRFPCHRGVLAASSEFFGAMFASSLKESLEGRVELKGISASTLSRLLDYIYTGRLTVDLDSVQDLLAAAALYQYPDVVSRCCEFLSRSLSAHNSLGIESFARHHSCEDLAGEARRFTLENFVQVSDTEEFWELGVERLEEYMSSDSLEVRCEDAVFDAAVRWIGEKAERSAETCRIFAHVRFASLSRDHLNRVVAKHAHIAECSRCTRLLEIARKYLLSSTDERLAQEFTESCALTVRPRPSTILREFMMVVGGLRSTEAQSVVQTVEAFDPVKNKWTFLPSIPSAVINFSATVSCNDVYVIGGEVSDGIVTDVWRFVTELRSWVAAAALLAPRSRHASAAFEDKVYVMGGMRRAEVRRVEAAAREQASALSVECLDVTNNQWTVVITEIPFPRQMSQLMAHGSTLVEVGGTVNRFPTKKMEIYQCDHDGLVYSGEQYVLISEIQYAQFALLDGQFLILWEDSGQLIALSPQRRSYRQLTSCSQPRIHAGAALLGRKLFMCGGREGAAEVSGSVDCYDVDKNVWTECAAMLEPRMKHGCVTVKMS